jgi:hypothetical protein
MTQYHDKRIEEIQHELTKTTEDFAVAIEVLIEHGLQGQYFQKRFPEQFTPVANLTLAQNTLPAMPEVQDERR